MTTQIAVRLADELVRFIDDEIAAGRSSSRAELVSRALEREHRRLLAARDAEILTRHDVDDDDLGAVARHVRVSPRDLD